MAISKGDFRLPENRSVMRACAVLKCFERARELLGLAEIARQTGLSKATAYRILSTLVAAEMLEKAGKNQYTLNFNASKNRRFRVGYATQSEEFAFSRLVSHSIQTAAYDAGIELLRLDNDYSPVKALHNAEVFVRERVDLVIEFQTSETQAGAISSMLVDAGIPVIAIEIPHPGATYFGANNQRAGILAGRALAQACQEHWQGDFDELVLLDLPAAGPLVHARLTSLVTELGRSLHLAADARIRFIDCKGRFDNSLEAMRKYLRRTPKRRILLGAVNDPSCLGALRAFEEAGRPLDCLAVSHNCTLEARMELRRPDSRLIGSVAYFPEQYGDGIIRLALDRLRGKAVPAASFIKHQLIRRDSVDIAYPSDELAARQEYDSLLFSRH